jgi:hypothetical protein
MTNKAISYPKTNLIITVLCVIISIKAYSQNLPLTGGTLTGAVLGPNFIQTGTVVDLATAGTLATNGTNQNGGAINRGLESFTSLTAGQYLTINLGISVPISYISFGTNWSVDPRFIPSGFSISYSNDGNNFTNFITISNNTNQYPSYAVNITAQFWKLTINATQTGYSTCNISGFQIIATGVGSVANDYWNSAYSQPGIFTNSPVSIGTTLNPTGYMFAVNGSAIATSMTVQGYTSWPDYVFKPSYTLPTLTEVKTYIEQNHHLPEIPTAEQIEKEGLNLGEMNKLLVKKVEELTLYLIEKDKEIKSQNDINASQESEIKNQKAISKLLSEQLKLQEEQIDELKQQLKALTKIKTQ